MGAPNKKPTMMEVKNAINNLIREYSTLAKYLTDLDRTLGSYIKYKKDDNKFPTWVKKQLKEIDKETKENTK